MPSPQPETGAALEKLLQQFDQVWRHGPAPRLDDYVVARIPAGAGATRRELLAELVRVDLQYRWRLAGQGKALPVGDIRERPHLERYVERYPELGPPDRLSVELIAEEYWVRHVWGDQPGHAEYFRRFGQSKAG